MKKLISVISGTILLMAMTSLPTYAADSTEPSDVENLQATALDTAVSLTWDEATDDTGVEGYQVHYGTTPVIETGQAYDEDIDVGNILEYTVDSLENGTEYYFSVIAYDAAENESKSWAQEASATPSEDAGTPDDTDAPQVSEAEALNMEEVKVVFSEEVVLPTENPEDAFSIENDDTFEALIVLGAQMDEEDETNKTVILTTDNQEEGATYKLTVGIDIEDKAGNPIISGTSDTALFVGSGEEKADVDSEGPELVTVESTDNTHILVNFNETIVLSIDPAENFVITMEEDASKTLTVLEVNLGENTEGIEDAVALITTSPQEDVSYIVSVYDLADEAGNDINPYKGDGIFQGTVVPDAGDDDDDDGDDDGDGDDDDGDDDDDDEEEDLLAPKDVAKFLAESVLEAEKYAVTLSWEIPEENVGDTVEQILYMSENIDSDFSKKASLDPDVTEYEIDNLEAGEYWFKLTQKDVAGNESTGVIKKVTLAETGPGVVGLLLVSLGLGRVFGKKRRK